MPGDQDLAKIIGGGTMVQIEALGKLAIELERGIDRAVSEVLSGASDADPTAEFKLLSDPDDSSAALGKAMGLPSWVTRQALEGLVRKVGVPLIELAQQREYAPPEYVVDPPPFDIKNYLVALGYKVKVIEDETDD